MVFGSQYNMIENNQNDYCGDELSSEHMESSYGNRTKENSKL
jgi:hypothetical protein